MSATTRILGEAEPTPRPKRPRPSIWPSNVKGAFSSSQPWGATPSALPGSAAGFAAHDSRATHDPKAFSAGASRSNGFAQGGGEGRREAIGVGLGGGLGGRLHHDADQRLGARRAHQHPAGVTQLGLDGRDLGPEARSASARPARSATRTLRSTWGSFATTEASSDSGRPDRARTSRRTRPDSSPSPVVARSPKMMWPDCSPPEREAAGLHGLEDGAVPHRGGLDPDALGRHGLAEPEVGHDRGHHRVVAEAPPGPQVEGGDGQDVVAVDEAAPLVDRHQPVGVAVEGQSGRRPRWPPPRPAGGPGWVEPQPALMLVAVGVGADVEVLDLGPELARAPSGRPRVAAPLPQSITTRRPSRRRPFERR